MSIWDDPDLAAGEVSYLKLDKVGDGVEGTITAIATQVWDDGKRCPQLTIATDIGGEIVWSAGQVQAKAQLQTLRPEVGDRIKVVLTQIEKRSGGKTLKHLSIDTTPGAKRGGATAALDGGSKPPAGLDAAAWAALDPSRKAEVLASMNTVNSAQPPF